MRFNAYTPPGFWERTKWVRIAFLGGLAVGVLIGWFFHGVISFILQFGLVAILLLPLLIIGYLWWRSTRRQGGSSVMTWSSWSERGPNRGAADPFDAARRADRSDQPSRSDADDSVYDLDALIRERERERGERRP